MVAEVEVARRFLPIAALLLARESRFTRSSRLALGKKSSSLIRHLSSDRPLGQPYPLFYDCFNPSTGDGPETNALFKGTPHGIHRFDVSINDTGTKAQFSFPDTSTETLSASILALVLSTEPTAEQPLTVILETHPTTPAPWFEDFSKSPDWKADESTPENQVKRSCTFVWDPHTAALTQGSVPAARIVRELNRSIHIEAVPPEASEDESTEPIDSLPK